MNAIWFNVCSYHDADKFLRQIKIDDLRKSVFLVRPSTDLSKYALTVKHNNRIMHFHINVQKENKFYLSGMLKKTFNSIEELINFYRVNEITYDTRFKLDIPFSDELLTKNQDWYLNCTSDEAYNILENCLDFYHSNKNIFLVRPFSEDASKYVLCVRRERRTMKFRIHVRISYRID